VVPPPPPIQIDNEYLSKILFCKAYDSLNYKLLGNIKIMMNDIKLTMVFKIIRYGV
jgi:hypothetical protein